MRALLPSELMYSAAVVRCRLRTYRHSVMQFLLRFSSPRSALNIHLRVMILRYIRSDISQKNSARGRVSSTSWESRQSRSLVGNVLVIRLYVSAGYLHS
jgi:hypothetical protein